MEISGALDDAKAENERLRAEFATAARRAQQQQQRSAAASAAAVRSRLETQCLEQARQEKVRGARPSVRREASPAGFGIRLDGGNSFTGAVISRDAARKLASTRVERAEYGNDSSTRVERKIGRNTTPRGAPWSPS